MATERKKKEIFPPILTAIKVTKNLTSIVSGHKNNIYHEGEMISQNKHVSGGVNSRPDFTTHSRSMFSRIAWAAHKNDSVISPINDSRNDTPKPKLYFGRIPSVMILGRSSSLYEDRPIKELEVEDDTIGNLARQKTELASLYKDTPITDTKATYREILCFLYNIWEGQMSVSYKQTASTMSSKQEITNVSKVVQTMVKNPVKLRQTYSSVNFNDMTEPLQQTIQRKSLRRSGILRSAT